MRSHQDYTVGWITALPVEMAAASTMLDERHADLPQPATDDNKYILGSIFHHNVVVACLPAGVYGTVSAATVVSHMVSTFSNLQYGLMVGIGGGVPNENSDIRLGDVVVSQPTGNYGGVVHYDIGKVMAGGEFQQNQTLNLPPQVLLTSISLLQADQLGEQKYSFAKMLEDRLESRDDAARAFPPPGREHDVLFNAHYNHKDMEGDDCTLCDRGEAVPRGERAGNDPRVHYGLIASGNKLMRDSKVRDELARKYGILCFEMEAAGLMNQLPCLVIRGICDYSDSHKNKKWQGYAAVTAAAYGRLLLSVVPARRLQESTTSMTFEETQCLKCLFTTDAAEDRSSLKRRKGDRVTGTAEWILETEELRKWLDGEYSILWLHGNPGTGKSTVAVAMTEQLAKDPRFLREEKLLAYFFCDSISENRRTVTSILRTLLYQLIEQRPVLMKPFLLKYAVRGEDLFASFDALWSLLVGVGQNTASGVYCIIDALDECDMESQLTLLSEICRTFPSSGPQQSKIHFLITSRPYREIGRELGNFLHRDLGSYPEIKSDLGKFIQSKVDNLAKRNRYSSGISSEVSLILREKSEGTFLWAGLACDELRSVRSRDAIQKLRRFPTGLRQLYRALLDGALTPHEEDRQTIMDILAFVAVAQRPVVIEDLIDACELYEDSTVEERLMYATEDIELCRLLVIIQDSNVRLLHQSVKDFLLGRDEDHPINDLEAHAQLANSCINHILRICSGTLEDVSQSTFLGYAVLYWPNHASLAGCKFKVCNKHQSFFKIGSTEQVRWLRMYKNIQIYSKIPEGFTTPHIAARWGILPLANLVMENRTSYQDADFQAGNGLTPLQEAASSGKIELFSFLLRQVAPDIMIDSKTLLSAASNKHNGDQIMMELFAVMGGRIPIAHEVMEAAVMNTQLGKQITDVILNHCSDIHITEKILLGAAENEGVGRDVLYLILTVRREEIDVTETVARAAVSNRVWGKEMMQVLLDWGGNIPITDMVVEAASRNRHRAKDIISLLLDRCPDQIEVTEDVLIAAAENEQVGADIISLLLKRAPDEIVITDDVLVAAAGNKQAGRDILRQLLRREVSEDLITLLADNPSAELVESLIGPQEQTTYHSENEVSKVAISPGLAMKPHYTLMCTLLAQRGRPTNILFTPCGGALVGAFRGHDVRIWDPWNGQLKHKFRGWCDWRTRIKIAPDLRSVASAARTSGLTLWTPKGATTEFTGHSDDILAIAFSADGTRIVTGSRDNTVRVWDVRVRDFITPRDPDVLYGHSRPVLAVTISESSKLIGSGGQDGTARIWDRMTQNCIGVLPHDGRSVGALAFTSDDTLVATCSGGMVRLWDVETGQPICALDGNDDIPLTIAFSPDNKLLASTGPYGHVQVWNMDTKELKHTMTHPSPGIHTVIFSPDGRTLASASTDTAVRLWDTHSGDFIRDIGAGFPGIQAIAFSRDGASVACASDGKLLSLWNAKDGSQQVVYEEFEEHAQTGISISADGNVLAYTAGGGVVRLCSPMTGQDIRRLHCHKKLGSGIQLSPNGAMLATGNAGTSIDIWETKRGTVLKTLWGHKGTVDRLTFSADSQLLASACSDSINLWKPASGILLCSWQASRVNSLAFAPNNRFLIATLAGQIIKVWDVSTGVLQYEISNMAGDAIFSPASELVVSVSSEYTIGLHDSVTGDWIATLVSHYKLTGDLALSPSGLVLASLTCDGTITLWDMSSRRPLQTIEGRSPLCAPILFSSDGKLFACAARDGAIHVWGTDI